jgi:hypothetical protein
VDEKPFAARLLDQIELMAEELEAKDKTIQTLTTENELLRRQIEYQNNFTTTWQVTRSVS